MILSKKRLPAKEYHDLINQVFTRDKWACTICKYRSNLQAHHVIFRSQGGEDRLDNLLTVCSYCHEDIHSGLIKIVKFEYTDNLIILDTIKKASWIPKMKVR